MSAPRLRSPLQRPTLAAVRRALRHCASARDAAFLQRYFRTGPGEYGAGDRFLGIRMPALRHLARAAQGLPLGEVTRLLGSGWHEERLLALLLLVDRYRCADGATRERLYRLYLRQRRQVNNWDLVDLSAPGIVGAHLLHRDPGPLLELASSPLLWERRIALLATLPRIRQGHHALTLRITRQLLRDPHDLIHKAAGWMLREVGKRDRAALERFLGRHAAVMPRTMLRYAIERLPARARARHLASGR